MSFLLCQFFTRLEVVFKDLCVRQLSPKLGVARKCHQAKLFAYVFQSFCIAFILQEEASEVVELDSVQTKEMSTKPPAALERPAGIKLTLTSSTKSTIEAEKRQQTKKAKLAIEKEQDAGVIRSDSDSDWTVGSKTHSVVVFFVQSTNF